ncbi:tyrosinase family protein [Massilia sp. ST3]|uniref:tyrosinase family protein n=1 Tax=Massilia sp. ST3 TaxID=2824903 RepID=UPI001B81D0F2|nr:tyrosinase family protein [Massilia sp. ST3]MBQ5948694.1 tyrosinase family protein [Massilia sp. ST3]
MRCRKNFIDLSPVERERLADAFNDAFSRGVIASMAGEHDAHFNHGIHWGPAFLPWHRHFLLLLEGELRQFDDRVSLPYWDWTRPDSRDIDVEPWKSFFGGRNKSGGRFDHWDFVRRSDAAGVVLPSIGDVLGELGAADYPAFRAIECGTHFPAHNWVGESMSGGRSPDDPLFYLHHCNVDRIWAIWQLNHPAPGVEQYSGASSTCNEDSDAFVDLNSPMHGGATPASMLNHVALGYVYHRDDVLLAAAQAQGMAGFIAGDPLTVTLDTPQVTFNDVPEGDTTHRAALFKISGCGGLMFEAAITSGPFTLADPSPYSFPGSAFPTGEFRIWVQFTGQAPGTSANGTMRVVAHNSFGDELWRDDDIPIAANSVRRPRASVTMVLDESGSMLANAGNNRMRLEVLQFAATTFVDQLYDDNGVAMVAFSDAAQTVRDLEVAGPLTSGVRNDVRLKITQHGPPDAYPHTCIGAGIQQAADLIGASPIAGDFEINATIVFTDGIEDRSPRIADVQHLITDRLYAVGVADAANVQNDILRAIADGTGGFMLVTGALAQDDEFLLEKFFIQILAGVLNRDIVRDPEGSVGFGEIARVPFWITRSDIAFDAVALTRAPPFLAIALQAPDGTIIGVPQLPAGAYRPGATSRNLRVTLPVLHDGKEHWEGEWQLLLALMGRGDSAKLANIPGAMSAAGQARLPFHALIHARSNLNMRAALSQTGVAPGSTLFLRASLSEYGRPLGTHPVVNATVTLPDHSSALMALHETDTGVFEASVLATQNGVYRFHVVAEGHATRGARFSREQLLSAVIGRAPQPGDPRPGEGNDGGPGGKGDDGVKDLLCCLLSERVLTGQFAELAKRLGIDLDQLRRCARHVCHPRDEPDQPPVLR